MLYLTALEQLKFRLSAIESIFFPIRDRFKSHKASFGENFFVNENPP